MLEITYQTCMQIFANQFHKQTVSFWQFAEQTIFWPLGILNIFFLFSFFFFATPSNKPKARKKHGPPHMLAPPPSWSLIATCLSHADIYALSQTSFADMYTIWVGGTTDTVWNSEHKTVVETHFMVCHWVTQETGTQAHLPGSSTSPWQHANHHSDSLFHPDVNIPKFSWCLRQ